MRTRKSQTNRCFHCNMEWLYTPKGSGCSLRHYRHWLVVTVRSVQHCVAPLKSDTSALESVDVVLPPLPEREKLSNHSDQLVPTQASSAIAEHLQFLNCPAVSTIIWYSVLDGSSSTHRKVTAFYSVDVIATIAKTPCDVHSFEYILFLGSLTSLGIVFICVSVARRFLSSRRFGTIGKRPSHSAAACK